MIGIVKSYDTSDNKTLKITENGPSIKLTILPTSRIHFHTVSLLDIKHSNQVSKFFQLETQEELIDWITTIIWINNLIIPALQDSTEQQQGILQDQH